MDSVSRDELRKRLNGVIWADTHGRGSNSNDIENYRAILELLKQKPANELYDSHKVYNTPPDAPLQDLSEVIHNQISFDHRFSVGAPDDILEGLNDDWAAPQHNPSRKWRDKWFAWRLRRELAKKETA